MYLIIMLYTVKSIQIETKIDFLARIVDRRSEIVSAVKTGYESSESVDVFLCSFSWNLNEFKTSYIMCVTRNTRYTNPVLILGVPCV